MFRLAHYTETKGKAAEVTARLALMLNGWRGVSKPETDESYDIVAQDPLSGKWCTFQVKSIHVRRDRGGDLVVYARKKNGEPYAPSDVDYIVGVLGAEEAGGVPRVWMFENRGCGEYWASEARASERWIEMPLIISDLVYGIYGTEVVENA